MTLGTCMRNQSIECKPKADINCKVRHDQDLNSSTKATGQPSPVCGGGQCPMNVLLHYVMTGEIHSVVTVSVSHVVVHCQLIFLGFDRHC